MLPPSVCVASMVRIFYLSKVATTDPTWTAVDPSMWSSIELCLGVVSACLPTMRPLLRTVFRIRIRIGLATSSTQNSTKMSKLNNSYGSSGYGAGSRKGSLAAAAGSRKGSLAAAAGSRKGSLAAAAAGSRKGSLAAAAAGSRKGSLATPLGGINLAGVPEPNGQMWPGYSATEQEYKATLDRDLDPVGFRHAMQQHHQRMSSIVDEPIAPRYFNKTGVVSEVGPGPLDTDRDRAGSEVIFADDDIRRYGGQRSNSRSANRDPELGLPPNAIMVKQTMKWGEEDR